MMTQQIKKLTRESGRPYITIVDSGLAMTIQWFLTAMYFQKIDPEGLDEWPQLDDFDEEHILEMGNRLANELQKRTF